MNDRDLTAVECHFDRNDISAREGINKEIVHIAAIAVDDTLAIDGTLRERYFLDFIYVSVKYQNYRGVHISLKSLLTAIRYRFHPTADFTGEREIFS